MKKLIKNELCSPKTLENDSFESIPDPVTPSTSCNRYSKDKCVGGKNYYNSLTNYNDCYFDVYCPNKSNADSNNLSTDYILIYQNCPFERKCCYKYDEVAHSDPSKIGYFPSYVTLDKGEQDFVSFCRWKHQNPSNQDGDIFHVIKILEKGICNPSYNSCTDYMYGTPLGNKPLPLGEKIKFLQVNEVFAEVFPNPFEQTIDIRLHQNKSPIIKLGLYDLMGRLVQNEQTQLTDGNAAFRIDTNDKLPKGMYILLLEGEGYRLQYPLIHQ